MIEQIEQQDRPLARVLKALRRRWWVLLLALVLAWPGYYIMKDTYWWYDEHYGVPYKRFGPFCWRPGDLVILPGKMTPEFYREILPALAKYRVDVPGSDEFEIYIRRPLTGREESDIWNDTTDAVYRLLARKWNIPEMSVSMQFDVDQRAAKDIPEAFESGQLVCKGVRMIAIQPLP